MAAFCYCPANRKEVYCILSDERLNAYILVEIWPMHSITCGRNFVLLKPFRGCSWQAPTRWTKLLRIGSPILVDPKTLGAVEKAQKRSNFRGFFSPLDSLKTIF